MDEIKKYLDAGIAFEGQILGQGMKIRAESKHAYGSPRLDARLSLISTMTHLVQSKSGIPGITNQSISNRLSLIAVFMQGTNHTESLVSEGQYFRAAAVLKQDYEILTRIHAIKKGEDVHGKTPNVKHAPAGSQHLYSGLNNIAHISMQNLIDATIARFQSDDIDGVSAVPAFDKKLALDLYDLHLWTMLEICREQIVLFSEMYGSDSEDLDQVKRYFIVAIENLIKAGFKIEED
jgi:hypothetical protein